MTTTPAMPEHIAHVEDWPDDRTSIGLVWDVDPKSVPVGTKLYALATLQAQPAEVSDEDILSLGQRNAWRYKYSSDPAHSSTYTFNDVCLVQFARAILALRPQAVPMTDEPQWIVNDLGELGVKVGPRFFFLYKGDNIEYGTDEIGDSRDGVALHDDGTPMHFRIVGKREFGETCWPLQWVVRGHSEGRYTEPLTFIPGLSWGKPEDGEWKPLPSRGITAPAGGEG